MFPIPRALGCHLVVHYRRISKSHWKQLRERHSILPVERCVKANFADDGGYDAVRRYARRWARSMAPLPPRSTFERATKLCFFCPPPSERISPRFRRTHAALRLLKSAKVPTASKPNLSTVLWLGSRCCRAAQIATAIDIIKSSINASFGDGSRPVSRVLTVDPRSIWRTLATGFRLP